MKNAPDTLTLKLNRAEARIVELESFPWSRTEAEQRELDVLYDYVERLAAFLRKRREFLRASLAELRGE